MTKMERLMHCHTEALKLTPKQAKASLKMWKAGPFAKDPSPQVAEIVQIIKEIAECEDKTS